MSTPKCVYNYEQLRSVAPPSPPGPHGFACDYLFVAGLPDPQHRGLEGFFEWRPESTANDNGGTVIKPSVLKLTDKGRWHRVFEGAISVKWFGAKGDGVADDTAAISAALAALPAWNASPPETPGGIIFFPPGTYLFSRQIALSTQTNVTFRGAGARYMQDFSASTSRLLYTGGGSTPAIYVSTNYARGWQVENLEISYNNAGGTFTGSLIQIDLTAGICFKHSVLGGASSTAASAEAVVKISGTERVTFQECLIQFAQRCVWIPTGTPSDGAGNTALITIRDCQLGNITRAHVEVESGNAVGTIIKDNLFDNTTLINPPYGLILIGNGFSITGNTFSGGDQTKTPTTMYVDLAGYGEFCGNTLFSTHPGIRLNAGGSFHVSGNLSVGNPPLTIVGGALRGGGNTWAVRGGATVCVNVASGQNVTTLDIGPDICASASPSLPSAFLGNSYIVSATSYATNGVIRYDPSFDLSSDGPLTTSQAVVLANQRLQSFYLANPPRGNIGAAGETTLVSQTIPAKSLDKNGKGFRFHAWGTTAANAAAKRIRILFGATVLYDTGSPTPNAIPWEFQGSIYRIGSGSQQCFVAGHYNGATVAPQHAVAALDLTADQAFYVLGTGSSADDDIVLQGFDLLVVQ